MGFFRSSESKSSRSKSRFSFRRHSDDVADVLLPPTKQLPPPPPPPPSHQTRKVHSTPERPALHASASSASSASSVRATFVSSASTSASSSVTSPTALQRAANDSELETKKSSSSASSSSASASSSSAKRTSDSLASTDTDDSEFLRTPSESSVSTPRGSSFSMASAASVHDVPSARRAEASASHRDSQGSNHSARSSRQSLVGYRQLHCSMSYKNRMATGSDDALGASFSASGRRSETGRTSSSRGSGTFLRSRENSGHLTNIDELAPSSAPPPPSPPPSPPLSSPPPPSSSTTTTTTTAAAAPPASPSSSSPIDIPAPSSSTTSLSSSSSASSSVSSFSSSSSLSPSFSAEPATAPSVLLSGRMADLRHHEASVAALQTRRAFQQMVLALEEEDDGDSSDYDDSDSESVAGRRSSRVAGAGVVVQLAADDYRKFQFRLAQLEELCDAQARTQAHMEEAIEREVRERAKKVVDAMEKKIAMYKQAKDLEVEREIARRADGRASGALVLRESSFYGASAANGLLPPLGSSPGAGGDASALKGKPLDKIFHPRRTRRRMELLRAREELQKREMEQFREFIRTTEMAVGGGAQTRDKANSFLHDSQRAASEVHGAQSSARESIKALRDPHITEDLLGATPNELIEMICVLRKHVGVQEKQLDEAKRLISAAIEAREEAEETAREAVELTLELDTRLERASQEMVVIKDELRRSSDFSVRSSYLLSSMGPSERGSQQLASSLSSSSRGGGALAAAGAAPSHLPRNASFPEFAR